MPAWMLILYLALLALACLVCWVNGSVQNRFSSELSRVRKHNEELVREIILYREVTGLIFCSSAFIQETNLIHLHVIIASRGDTVVLSDDAYAFPSAGLIAQLQLLR